MVPREGTPKGPLRSERGEQAEDVQYSEESWKFPAETIGREGNMVFRCVEKGRPQSWRLR